LVRPGSQEQKALCARPRGDAYYAILTDRELRREAWAESRHLKTLKKIEREHEEAERERQKARRYFGVKRPPAWGAENQAGMKHHAARMVLPSRPHRSFLPRFAVPITDKQGRLFVFQRIRYYSSAKTKQGHCRERAAYAIDGAHVFPDGSLAAHSNLGDAHGEILEGVDVVEQVNRTAARNAKTWVHAIMQNCHLMTPEEQFAAAKAYAEDIFGKQGLPYLVVLHPPSEGGDARNWHVHLLFSFRPVTRVGEGEWEIGRHIRTDLDSPEQFARLRYLWACELNAACEKAGIDRRYTHLSYAASGIDCIPQTHLGEGLTAKVRRGEHVKINLNNHRIAVRNMRKRVIKAVRAELMATAAQVRASVQFSLDAALAAQALRAAKPNASERWGMQPVAVTVLPEQSDVVVKRNASVKFGLRTPQAPRLPVQVKPAEIRQRPWAMSAKAAPVQHPAFAVERHKKPSWSLTATGAPVVLPDSQWRPSQRIRVSFGLGPTSGSGIFPVPPQPLQSKSFSLSARTPPQELPQFQTLLNRKAASFTLNMRGLPPPAQILIMPPGGGAALSGTRSFARGASVVAPPWKLPSHKITVGAEQPGKSKQPPPVRFVLNTQSPQLPAAVPGADPADARRVKSVLPGSWALTPRLILRLPEFPEVAKRLHSISFGLGRKAPGTVLPAASQAQSRSAPFGLGKRAIANDLPPAPPQLAPKQAGTAPTNAPALMPSVPSPATASNLSALKSMSTAQAASIEQTVVQPAETQRDLQRRQQLIAEIHRRPIHVVRMPDDDVWPHRMSFGKSELTADDVSEPVIQRMLRYNMLRQEAFLSWIGAEAFERVTKAQADSSVDAVVKALSKHARAEASKWAQTSLWDQFMRQICQNGLSRSQRLVAEWQKAGNGPPGQRGRLAADAFEQTRKWPVELAEPLQIQLEQEAKAHRLRMAYSQAAGASDGGQPSTGQSRARREDSLAVPIGSPISASVVREQAGNKTSTGIQPSANPAEAKDYVAEIKRKIAEIYRQTGSGPRPNSVGPDPKKAPMRPGPGHGFPPPGSGLGR
jgi:hypothetical protein